jgi:hypothetical protein
MAEGEDKDKKESGAQALTVKVGEAERAFTADDVAQLLKESEGAKGELGKFSKVVDVLKKYDTDVDTYVGQTEAALAVVSALIEKGIIDNKGNVIKREAPPKESGDKGGGGFDWNRSSGKGEGDTRGAVGEERVAAIVNKALEGLSSRLKGIEETQGSLLQSTLEAKVKAAHPELDAEDVERVFETAYREPKKRLMDHAKDYADRKASRRKEMKAEVAKELGFSLEEYEEKLALKEKMRASGDELGLLTLAQGKKLTFKPEKGDKTAVSPRTATEQFFKQQGR